MHFLKYFFNKIVIYLAEQIIIFNTSARTHTHRLYIIYNIIIFSDDENDLLNFQYSFDTSLSRNKRSILLSPIKSLVLQFTKLGNNVVKNVLDVVDFAQSALTGQNVCPEIKELSFQKISKEIVSQPAQTIKTIICYSLQGIGTPRRVLMLNVFNLLRHFFFRAFLPGLHTVLNSRALKIARILSPSFLAFVTTFNAIYRLLRIIGYVP